MLLTIFLGFCLIGLLIILKYLTQHRGIVESFGLPYIKPFLCFGSPPFLFNYFIYSDWMIEQFKKFGKTWARYDGVSPCIVTIDPEMIKQITVKQFENFTETFDMELPDNQMTLDVSGGDTWRALRKLLSPTFTTGKMKGMLEPMDKLADRTIEYLSERAKTQKKIDVKPVIQGFALDTISKCAFGMDTNAYKGEDTEFATIAKDVFEQFRATGWIATIFFNVLAHFPILVKYVNMWPASAQKIRQMTHDNIEARIKQNIDLGDFIDRLKQFKNELEPPITADMIDAQGIVFLTAGFETTANTLGSVVYLLAKNPDVQEQLLDEINNVCDSAELINHETIKDMHLLEATIMETLRLRPPVTEHDRVCTKDCEVNGIKIPKGTRIQMPNLPAHLDEEYFPEPNLFKPERFLKENSDQIQEFTWRPFGSGNRVCIGQRFSMIEMKIFLAKLISRFRIVSIPETKVEVEKGDLFMLYYNEMIVQLDERV